MTADQIRAEVKALQKRIDEYDVAKEMKELQVDIQLITVYLVGELAAQVAEMQERLKRFIATSEEKQ